MAKIEKLKKSTVASKIASFVVSKTRKVQRDNAHRKKMEELTD